MKTFLLILGINFLIFMILFLYCSCKVASKADEEIKRIHKEK